MSYNNTIRNEIYRRAWTTRLIQRSRLVDLTRIPLNEMNVNHRSLISDLAWEEIRRQQ
jgi:Fe-S cluster biosynthesis and repair protein YggX